jgi:hypothetical protein
MNINFPTVGENIGRSSTFISQPLIEEYEREIKGHV